jgi:hypothetical protein
MRYGTKVHYLTDPFGIWIAGWRLGRHELSTDSEAPTTVSLYRMRKYAGHAYWVVDEGPIASWGPASVKDDDDDSLDTWGVHTRFFENWIFYAPEPVLWVCGLAMEEKNGRHDYFTGVRWYRHGHEYKCREYRNEIDCD